MSVSMISGISQWQFAQVSLNNILYIGGSQESALGVCKLVGGSFDAVGSLGLSATTLATDGTTLYAGTSDNKIWRLDGSSWTNIGTAGGEVKALAVDSSGNLYAAGSFLSIGGVSIDAGFAKYSASAWSSIGNFGQPPNGLFLLFAWGASLLANGSDIYIGGTTFGASGVVKYSAGTFTEIGAFSTGINSCIGSLYLDGTTLYAGGVHRFPSSTLYIGKNLLKCDLTAPSWVTVGVDLGSVRGIAKFDSKIVVVGGDDGNKLIAGAVEDFVLDYDNTTWTAPFSSLSLQWDGRSVTVNDGKLYASGSFDGVACELSAAPSIPTTVDGDYTINDADDGLSDNTITFTHDLTVEAAGNLLLDVPSMGDLAGDKIITIKPHGKIKLAGGRKVTVLDGTKGKIHT